LNYTLAGPGQERAVVKAAL